MNLKFRKPCLEDKKIIESLSAANKDINSESAFGTSYIWNEIYDIKICFYNNVFLKKIGNAYAFPKGIKSSEELKQIITLLKEDSLNLNSFKLTELLTYEVEFLERVFPKKFEITVNRNDCEYIYSIKDLAQLSGKKYHSKRNHISKFNKLYKWKYSSKIDADECLDFFNKWFKVDSHEENLLNINEYIAISKALSNFSNLNLCGGIIKIEDKIIACTIGEKINSNALLVHFEKAFSNFDGSYTVINNEFCKDQQNNFELVNREEDMGIPGLRKSKLSYRPKILLKKYNAIWKDL